jgi:hypothetical protein
MRMDLFFRRCYDPGTMLAIAAISGATSIAGGIAGESAANTEAKQQEAQGGIALQEANTNANLETTNLTTQVQNQQLQFLANGVSLDGSPSKVIAASKNYAQTQVQSILNEGAAQFNLAQEQGAETKNQGRAALIGSIAGAASSVAGAGSKAYQAGLFTNNSTSGGVFAGPGQTSVLP